MQASACGYPCNGIDLRVLDLNNHIVICWMTICVFWRIRYAQSELIQYLHLFPPTPTEISLIHIALTASEIERLAFVLTSHSAIRLTAEGWIQQIVVL
jgi:hypothetical protein